ncbi:tRNA (adenosine(37)-N6)-threonylcarbamoyltransferase complex dimerization subunit type 1 TsaB [Treponema sp.]|jgi:tRNA threonylcarbamoyladenosine biosynthesis protein TsaB|uniref:tRNA (adenosine(37)-N6)-threonylcarbamoyltransferase complex dimerization subunit type 1 TsaB n=1 Tax=Treponema sp. TaxID=166 RepID=UPI00257BEBD5|nr:tRNA (adenosine(37)-N6)-threonylcarbamoyltransferase complex dimerization subunit type 1 TsaB [Treponema sp.]MBE6354126.1 tRNA (adenosine(37)-N6)-threonylcarbamoyltransferase complex dimerization subunit type 1 TsaB [Treponema sp.]
MNALAIDCAVSKITVAVKKENNLIKLTLDVGIKQSEKLLPAVDYVMKEAGLKPADLDYTACTSGPGTFTGLRLGMSTLKALNLSHNIPLYGIPSLEAYSWPYKRALETVLPLIEAKEDEYFCNFFVRGQKLREDEDLTVEEILKQIDAEAGVLACGPGAKNFTERVNTDYPMYSVHSFLPENDSCESLFEIAEKMIAEKKEPLSDYDGPLYVRKSEAEIVREKKLSEEKQS